MPDAAVAERTLPHNLEAERSVLGAVLLHNDAFNLAAEVIDSSDFFRDAHRRIFEKMVKLSERGDAIDLVTLKEELGRSGELDEVGGPAVHHRAGRRRSRDRPTSSITRASSRRRRRFGA
jgi:replicative DNA helicase